MIAPNPIIVVEVVSPTSTARDMGAKYANYFRHPACSITSFCLSKGRLAVLHSRGEGEMLKSRIAREGDRLTLDPPGIEVAVSDFFAGLDSAFAD